MLVWTVLSESTRAWPPTSGHADSATAMLWRVLNVLTNLCCASAIE